MDSLQNFSKEQVRSEGFLMKLSSVLEKYPIILQLFKFGAIGIINTALDFSILNLSSKALGIESGLSLGGVNILGFIAAVIQSYYWNRYWTFGIAKTISVVKNFLRLIMVGALGFLALILVLWGASIQAPVLFYLVILAVFVMIELILWYNFGFFKTQIDTSAGQFMSFIIVSIIGLIINSILIGVITGFIDLTSNADLNKNLAKIVATFASLVWNFIGYKIFVFKK